MPIINCLETANKSYGEDFDKEKIKSTFDQLKSRVQAARASGENVDQVMTDFSNELTRDNEIESKAAVLREIKNTQQMIDTMQMVNLFREAGHAPDVAVERAITARLSGASWKVARNRDNTWTKKKQAMSTFYRDFASDLKGELFPLFNSSEGQVELAQALYDVKAGKPVEGSYGEIAKIVVKYYDMLYDSLEKEGVPIKQRDDRIAPNVHDVRKLTKLTKDERAQVKELYKSQAKESHLYGDPFYKFAFDRWNRDILPLIDPDKVFTENGFDKNDPAAVEAFQRKAFDELANKGKASQRGVNLGSKYQQSRVYHWKDGASLIEYNNKYGNESLQSSILKELSSGFGNIEVIKDWGTTPEALVTKTLEMIDKIDPELNQRFGKAREQTKLLPIARGVAGGLESFTGSIADFTNGLLTAESVTKLGAVTLTSVTDLANTAKIARENSFSQLAMVGQVAKLVIAGLSKADAKALASTVDTAMSARLGQLSRYSTSPSDPQRGSGALLHWAMKFFGLEWWDNGNKAYAASVTAQGLAMRRKLSWDQLKDVNRETLESYNLDSTDWDVIRQSNVKIGSRKKQFITPDSVQDIDDSVVVHALKTKGVDSPTKSQIANYRDGIERKLSTYFTDQQDHVIIVPDIIENQALTIGLSPSTMGGVPYAIVRTMSQFKSFPVAMFRRQLLPVLRGRGATTNLQSLNPFSGKFNWKGIATLAATIMPAAYMSKSLKNLSVGLSPPGLDKLRTWEDMLKESLGIVGQISQINWHDPWRSVANFVEGPVISDVEKGIRLGANFVQETANGTGYKKTKNSALQLGRGLIPGINTFYTKWMLNHLFLNQLEDDNQPGKREKHLRQVEIDTGAKELF